jgi:hypothetical protein
MLLNYKVILTVPAAQLVHERYMFSIFSKRLMYHHTEKLVNIIYNIILNIICNIQMYTLREKIVDNKKLFNWLVPIVYLLAIKNFLIEISV